MAGAVIFARLNGQTSAVNRIYPQVLPQGPTYPAVSYQVISTVRTHAMGGDSGVVRVRVQVNSFGRTYQQATDLAREVQIRLSRFRGVVAGQQVHDILLDNELESIEPDSLTRRVIQDYTLFLSPA